MKKAIILIAALVFVAGCTGRSVRVDENRGVTINLFSSDPTSTKSGNPVILELEIENIGGTTATDVTAELLGVQNQWRLTTAGFPPVPDTQVKGPYRLRPPAIDKDLPGDFKIIQWELVTPSVSQGIAPDYPITARVSYDYNTSGLLTIFAMKRDFFDKVEEGAIPEPEIPTLTFHNSPGPIKLTLDERSSQPIIVDLEDTEPFEYFPMRIIVVNGGDGFPITEDEFGRFTGTIELQGPGAEFEECLGQNGGTFIDLDDTEIPTKLRQSSTVSLSCVVKIDKAEWGLRDHDTVSIKFNIFYRYFVEQTTTVKVFGK